MAIPDHIPWSNINIFIRIEINISNVSIRSS
nr:MAG TPA: hypothetical protein [Caudoviricetes sp.]